MGIQDTAIQQILQNSTDMAPLQKESIKFGLDSSKTAYNQSQEDRVWSIGRRDKLTEAQDSFSDKVNQFDSEGKRAELASQAEGDVNQAFSNVRDQSARALARQGVNPNSGRAMATDNQLAIAQAAGGAGAATGARRLATDMAFNLQGQKANMLSGYPAMASGATGAGAGFGANGVTVANNGLTGLNSGSMSAADTAGKMGVNASTMYGVQANAHQAQQNNSSQGFGALLGAGASLGAAFI